ncbi:MAG TPA: hypothetical protein VIL46_19100 [Gemmataceae bacterium]
MPDTQARVSRAPAVVACALASALIAVTLLAPGRKPPPRPAPGREFTLTGSLSGAYEEARGRTVLILSAETAHARCHLRPGPAPAVRTGTPVTVRGRIEAIDRNLWVLRDAEVVPGAVRDGS